MYSIDRAELGLIIKALAFAADKHRHQRRKNAEASPYINHPIALADVLVNEAGIISAAVLCTALLHDTVEDTETSADELQAQFGATIAAYVLEVTDDKNLPKSMRKQLQVDGAPALSEAAKLVKLADKICNLRDMAEHAPVGWTVQRKREYFDWAKNVVDGLWGEHGLGAAGASAGRATSLAGLSNADLQNAASKLKAAFDAVYAQRPGE